MKKTVMILMLGILLVTGNGYAADGDLTVMGNIGVGIDADPRSAEEWGPQLHIHNPTRAWTYLRLTNLYYPKGYLFSIENGNVTHFAYDGMGIDFVANSGAANRQAGYYTRMHNDGRLSIGGGSPESQLSVYGTTPLALTGTVNITSGSNTITGTGTLFALELKPGAAIHINDGKKDQWGQVHGTTYIVSAITSNTTLTISSNYSGATASGLTAERDSDLFGIYNAAKDTKFLVTQEGNVGIGIITPQSKLAVAGLPTASPDSSGTKGIVCITNNGNMWIDTNSGDGVCN